MPHLTQKNSAMMKVMQLMDVMNNPSAEDLDTHRLVQASQKQTSISANSQVV